ncbi:MAG: hypothetical protein JWQ43_276 [Glaciihabitans sp.]|nr:hypothetical protein [Glaciihabitans sp.]
MSARRSDRVPPSPSEPIPDTPTPDTPTPNKPTPNKPTPNKPTPNKPTPNKPTPNKPTPDKPAPVDAATPTRSRIPLWGWIAGVLVIAIGATIVGVVTSGDDTPDSTATSTPSGEPSAATGGGLGSLDPTLSNVGRIDLPLSAVANFGVTTPPIWGTPASEDWESAISTQSGVSQIVNAKLGCVYTTSQNELADAEANPSSDLAASESSLDLLNASFAQQFSGAYVAAKSPNVGIPYGVPGSERLAEFLTSQIEYTNASNSDPYTAVFALRAMPALGGMLYSSLSCPTDVLQSEEEANLWGDLLSHSTVLAQ